VVALPYAAAHAGVLALLLGHCLILPRATPHLLLLCCSGLMGMQLVVRGAFQHAAWAHMCLGSTFKVMTVTAFLVQHARRQQITS
jgi:hypothetical protein